MMTPDMSQLDILHSLRGGGGVLQTLNQLTFSSLKGVFRI